MDDRNDFRFASTVHRVARWLEGLLSESALLGVRLLNGADTRHVGSIQLAHVATTLPAGVVALWKDGSTFMTSREEPRG
jgi:hypothetical protein